MSRNLSEVREQIQEEAHVQRLQEANLHYKKNNEAPKLQLKKSDIFAFNELKDHLFCIKTCTRIVVGTIAVLCCVVLCCVVLCCVVLCCVVLCCGREPSAYTILNA